MKAIFFYEEFLKEIEEKPGESIAQKLQRQMAILKYADAILLAKSVLKPNSTLELLVVEGLSKEEMQAMQMETFALIKLLGKYSYSVPVAKPPELTLFFSRRTQGRGHLLCRNGRPGTQAPADPLHQREWAGSHLQAPGFRRQSRSCLVKQRLHSEAHGQDHGC